MIEATTFAGNTVAVFGLGGSGRAAARALAAGGANVAAWDDSASARDAAAEDGTALVNLEDADWSQFAALVLAPGVPLTHPQPHWTVERARKEGVEVIGDVELFCRERAARAPDSAFIAITGTNGKSTTTALIAHLIGELGFDVQMGGNIGKAILTLEPPAQNRVYVIEMSSYQIDLTPSLHPSVGVLLNVTPDHIDRHGTIERYASIKERLVAAADAAVVGIEDAWTADVAARLEDTGKLYAISAGRGSSLVPRLYAIGQSLFVHETSGTYATSEEIARLSGIPSLRGAHNVQNALAALAALKALQDLAERGQVVLLDTGGDKTRRIWDPKRLRDGLKTFPGLAHRMEQVAQVGSILFINDSKATNADSADKALASFQGDIYWIAGGRPKAGGITTLKPHFGRIRRAYLVGEAQDEFARTLEGHVDFVRCGTLENAVEAAAGDAALAPGREAVVLFSPACASFDQFRNFEERGDSFRRIVETLPGIAKSRGAP